MRQLVELGQWHGALLLVGVCSGEDCDGGVGFAAVRRQMRYTGGDVEEVSRSPNNVFFELLAEPEYERSVELQFMWEQTETLLRWVTWAEQQVTGWPDDASAPATAEVSAVLNNISLGVSD